MPYSARKARASSGGSWAISISISPCSASTWTPAPGAASAAAAAWPSARLTTTSTGLSVRKPKPAMARLILGREQLPRAAGGPCPGLRQALEQRDLPLDDGLLPPAALLTFLAQLLQPPLDGQHVVEQQLGFHRRQVPRRRRRCPSGCGTASLSKARTTCTKPSICESWLSSWPGQPFPRRLGLQAADVGVGHLGVDRLARLEQLAQVVDPPVGHVRDGRVHLQPIAAGTPVGRLPPVRALKMVVLPHEGRPMMPRRMACVLGRPSGSRSPGRLRTNARRSAFSLSGAGLLDRPESFGYTSREPKWRNWQTRATRKSRSFGIEGSSPSFGTCAIVAYAPAASAGAARRTVAAAACLWHNAPP